jgi:hypothetical protein
MNNPKDPWGGTGAREAYVEPPRAKAVKPKTSIDFVGLIKTIVFIAVLLFAAKYAYTNYYLPSH